MHQRFNSIALAIGAAALGPLAGCVAADGTDEEAMPALFDEQADEPVAEAAQPITVSGMGHYCSVTWPNGGWVFLWDSGANSDPCATATGQYGPGGTIRRAGVYSVSGVNNVVARCDGGVTIWVSTGGWPLQLAYDERPRLDHAGRQRHHRRG